MFDYISNRNREIQNKIAANKAGEAQKQVEKQARMEVIRHRKNSLCAAIQTGEAQYIYNWCYLRALEESRTEALRNTVAFGVHFERLDDEKVLQIKNNWHKWYYRICRWWDIDHG